MLIVTLLVGEMTAVAMAERGGSGGVWMEPSPTLLFALGAETEGAGCWASICSKSDMTCIPSGLVALSLGRLCSCSGNSDPSMESLRLRVEASDMEDNMLQG